MTRVAALIWTINVVLAIVIAYTLVAGRRRKETPSGTGADHAASGEDRAESAHGKHPGNEPPG
jgi:hypothetical protein